MKQPLLTTDFLDRAVNLFGDDIGIVADDGTEFTYNEVGERVDRLSNALRERGVEKGNRVALLSKNSHYFIETLYATMQLGAVFVPLNFRLQPEEYDYLVDDCDPAVFITDNEHAEKVSHLRGDNDTDEWIAYDADEVDGQWDDYERVLEETSSESPERPDISEDDDATILYTSGTTGDPKGVVHTHRSQHYHAMIHSHHVEFEDDDVLLWTSPMFHLNGWGHIYGLTGVGGKHVVVRDFDPATVFERVNEYDVSFMGGAPTVLNLLLEHNENHDIRTSGVNPVRVETAASPPPKRTIRLTEEELGWRIIHAYGSTETGPLVATSNSRRRMQNGDKYDIINKPGFATLNTEIRVVDRDGNDVPLDDQTKGEVIVRGNQVLDRYWNKPAMTEEVFNDRVEGWFHTGDIATMDENKMISIVDRKKDIIISGGENISTIEVQNVIYEHPDVRLAAVIGVPHEKWGETPKALVVTQDGSNLTENDLIEFTRERLAHYKCPTSVEFRDELPQTSTGKIQKFELRDEYWGNEEENVN
ncbi:long-chain-fatty-acid--CoA ligase [Natronococcus jeotgali]|uniref:AMP-dependent synthetase and ligase n=1 Tax=Natronococcus jeotgali DSM 18795 TaxID=1227498 RepID=L9XMP7_9EURY|nr:long-chain-fatty-acid--CoA ligase [Natronococcus jeotgali]ELY61938.1 AMP-dependent synthetase and ligase [Natronococcus jeotgali DSM 18795]